MKTINELLNNAERFYAQLNQFSSLGTLPLLDAAYPEHDGQQDADVVSNMMLLRQRLNAIINGCNMAIEHLNYAIDD